MRHIRKTSAILALLLALSACDKPNAPDQASQPADADAKAKTLADRCYLGDVDACDAYRVDTGHDLPYAEGARKKAAKVKTKGAEF